MDALGEALQTTVSRWKCKFSAPLPLELYTSSNFIGLFVKEDSAEVLKKFAADFAAEAASKTGKSPRGCLRGPGSQAQRAQRDRDGNGCVTVNLQRGKDVFGLMVPRFSASGGWHDNQLACGEAEHQAGVHRESCSPEGGQETGRSEHKRRGPNVLFRGIPDNLSSSHRVHP